MRRLRPTHPETRSEEVRKRPGKTGPSGLGGTGRTVKTKSCGEGDFDLLFLRAGGWSSPSH